MLPVQRAGISLQVAGVGLEVHGASDDVAAYAEWAHISLGEGPGWDSMASGVPVVAPDLMNTTTRWPFFTSQACAAGIGAMYALPLQLGAIQVGVLDLYRDAPEPLGPAEFADAVAVAALMTAILLTAGSRRPAEAKDSWWDQPRPVREVYQATGMVMAQLDVDAKEAYARLQAYAYGRQRLIRDVAHDVVLRRLRFKPDPNPEPEAEPQLSQRSCDAETASAPRHPWDALRGEDCWGECDGSLRAARERIRRAGGHLGRRLRRGGTRAATDR